MQVQTPPQTPWGALNGTNGDHNEWADGTGGRELEAMGEMYEVSTNITILNLMISWADDCTSQRNDLMSAADGGQRVMWTGKIDEVWCPNEPTSPDAGYAGSENEDVEGHVAFCAKLILETPSIWNTTVPDGDPYGYGTTYYQRATNYLARCDQANEEYSLKWFIQAGTSLIVAPTNAAWVAFNENVSANNRQMMFTSGFQRLAEAHQILGDNPSLQAQYDAIVLATVNQDLTGMINFDPYTKDGQPVYDWGYYPTNNAPESTEIHAEYDIIGIYRAFNRTNYGLTLSPLVPFANTMVDVIYLGTNTFAGDVSGGSGGQSPIYSGWILSADWNPEVYTVVAGAAYAKGWFKTSADIEAGILWMKNRRYLEFSVAATPDSQTVQSGQGTSFTTTVTPLGGFTNTVNMTVSGLPSGASGSFNNAAINLATISAATTNVTLSVSTSTSTPGGTYPLTITGTSGSVAYSTIVNLGVTDFSISATPSSQTVAVDGGTTYTVTIGNINGFGGTVNLSASGLPAGATAMFNPTSIDLLGSSTLTVTTTNSTPAGTYTLTITGTCGSLIHSTTVTLVVTDFSIAATPASQTVVAGGGTTYTNSVTALNGFGGNVVLSVSGLPAGASGGFNPTSVNGSGNSTLSVTTSNTTPAGNYTLTITGTSGSLKHSTTVTLAVTGFAIVATPATQTVTAGNVAVYTNSVTAINGFGGNVVFNVSGLPTGATGSFNPTSINGSGSSTLTISTTNTMPAGTNTLTITGTCGSLVNSTNVVLVVLAPTSTFAGIYEIQNITSGQALNQGGSTTNGSPISQWNWVGSVNEEFTFIATSNGYYQIQSVKSGLDVAVKSAATTNNAPLIQWSFGSSGDDQWKPVQNTNGTYAFYNLHSGLTLNNTGGSTNEGSQYSQWSWASSPNEEFNLSRIQTPVDLSAAFTREGMVTDGTTFSSTGGLDTHGYAYSANLLGTSLTNSSGVKFNFGTANASNVVGSAGQTITLPAGSFSTLEMLATAVNGSQTSQTFTVTYSDNSTSTFTQSVSDWGSSQGYTGETVASSMAYRDKSNGTTSSGTWSLYGYSFSINNTKTVSSITLPNNADVVIVGLTLEP